MLAGKYRLNKKAIGHVFKRGSRLHTPFFTVLFVPKYTELPRFSVVVSNKQAGTAPMRSRIKRRLRAMIREVFLAIHYDAIFLAKPSVVGAKWTDLVAAGTDVYKKMQHLVAQTDDKNLSENHISRP